MFAVAAALIAIVVSLLITRVAALALTATGMNSQVARFQARSAFSGVGFTTTEAEGVVHHPVRRRIIMILMLLGNAGVITIAASLIISFARAEQTTGTLFRLAILLGGLTLILIAANSPWIDRRLTQAIGKILGRWSNLEVRDYARLLQLAGEYGITELTVREDDWLAGKTLAELALRDEGVVVLGIQRPDGSYLGAPRGQARVEAKDTLILYGRTPRLTELDQRQTGREGEKKHIHAVHEHASTGSDHTDKNATLP